MDKIVALSSYFNITTDYLLKDEIETIDGADNYSSKNVDMQMLNKELNEVIEETILGMREVAEEIGLKGDL